MTAALRALLVEGDPSLRAYMRSVLEDEGIECVEVADGVEALMFASADGIDLVITDLDMPRLDGLGLLALISKGAFGTVPPPAIVCSGCLHDERYSARPELDLCATKLPKPVRADQLIEPVASAFPDS